MGFQGRPIIPSFALVTGVTTHPSPGQKWRQTRRPEQGSKPKSPQQLSHWRIEMKKLGFLLAVMLIAVGISVAQTDQNNPNSNPANSPSATQSSPSAQGSATTPDQGTANQSATDQSTTTTTTRHHRSAKSGNLPQTASPLPLLGLLGMGSLAAGVATRKKKRS